MERIAQTDLQLVMNQAGGNTLEKPIEERPPTDFEKVAMKQAGGNILGDFWYSLKANKKWWLLPILAMLLLFGALMLLSGTAAAPFIYTLF